MPKCQIKECQKQTRYNNTKEKYCPMHKERIKRHGYPELKRDAYITLEKLPHEVVDDYIINNYEKMNDHEFVKNLKSMGFKDVTRWNVGYRRRKLGVRKYSRGEIKKHKAWVRSQAIKEYGNLCELCGYNMTIDTHHILPKYKGGQHQIENLIVICPNCHALITRNYIQLKNRDEIPKVRKQILKSIRNFYTFL